MTYALVTGASKGIGKAIAIELAKRKINVLLVARSYLELQQTAEEISNTYHVSTDFLASDLSLANAATTVYNWTKEKQYAVSILVNNAGYGLSGPFEHYSIEEYTNMMQVNMLTTVQLCRIFLPELKQQPQSYILNIASSAAYQAVPLLSLYAASKAFVLNFSRGIAYELKDSRVSVTCVCPGPTDTGFNQRAQVGKKALNAAKKLNAQPQSVAATAINAMFHKKRERITGFINKLGAFFAWLLPKGFIETTSASLYK
jgi:short-subunit dehydrogenase